MPRFARKGKRPKRTVSLTIDSEIYRQTKELKVNASRVAEEALANEVQRRRAEALAAEMRVDMAAADAYIEKNGSFADLAREHFVSSPLASDDEAV